MRKCVICNSRKAKRSCVTENKSVCSECCGTTRKESECKGCSFYSPITRKYQDIPRFAIEDMTSNENFEPISNLIEGTLCAFDAEHNKSLNDLIMIKIIETLLDKYHYMDTELKFDDEILFSGFEKVNNAINNHYNQIDQSTLVKILSLLRFVAKRRTSGRREYLKIIHDYIGVQIAPGMRIVDMDRLKSKL